MNKPADQQFTLFSAEQASAVAPLPELEEQLTRWVARGALRPLDLALTRFIQEQDANASDLVLLATALVSQGNSRGDICLDLQDLITRPTAQLTDDEFLLANNSSPLQPAIDLVSTSISAGEELAQRIQGISLNTWLTELAASQAVTQVNSNSTPETVNTPLVLVTTSARSLLYLRRYWVYEQEINAALKQRLAQQLPIDMTAARQLLTSLFADNLANKQNLDFGLDWQQLACALAARASFSIITGGPGTGKTTTVVRLLALLQGLQLQAGLPPLTISLAAPTGKAAARLSESLEKSLNDSKQPEELTTYREHLPTQVSTLHRLLGSQAGTRHFRHTANNPLAADLVVVDEASMIDIEMLAHLLTALPAHTRLILLGDKDQLASVEAGSVLGDFCSTADAGNYTPATAAWLAAATGQELPPNFISKQGSALAQVTCKLRHSYRFSEFKGIGELATLVNSGTANLRQLEQIFIAYQAEQQQFTKDANLQLIYLERPTSNSKTISLAPSAAWLDEYLAPLKQLIKQGYHPYLELVTAAPAKPTRAELDKWASDIFAAHKEFQLLTVVRKGMFGVEGLNQLSLAALKEVPSLKPLFATASQWFSGRPVLMTRNDYSLKLMNGDIGICLAVPADLANPTGKKVLRVAFPDGAGGVRWVLPSRLQGVETVFALTVHKSQGSEFTHTGLVLPSTDNPILTKELLYTGITRSSEAFTLVCPNRSVLAGALIKQVTRASGLSDIL